MSIKLVLDAGSSLRGAAATLALLARERLLPLATPCFSTIRCWLLRVGHFALNQPLDTSVPWVWLLDHTIQVGSTKVLAIVGWPTCSSSPWCRWRNPTRRPSRRNWSGRPSGPAFRA